MDLKGCLKFIPNKNIVKSIYLNCYLRISPFIIIFSGLSGFKGLCESHDFKKSAISFFIISIFISYLFKFDLIKKLILKIHVFISFLVFIFFFVVIIARPNVKCYSSKYKAVEAKVALAAIYNAEIKLKEKYNAFSTCLEDLGNIETKKGYYLVGFATHDLESLKIFKTKNFKCNKNSYYFPSELLSKNRELLISVLKKQRYNLNENTFTAFAVGDPQSFNNEKGLDIWSINEKKELIHIQNPF